MTGGETTGRSGLGQSGGADRVIEDTAEPDVPLPVDDYAVRTKTLSRHCFGSAAAT